MINNKQKKTTNIEIDFNRSSTELNKSLIQHFLINEDYNSLELMPTKIISNELQTVVISKMQSMISESHNSFYKNNLSFSKYPHNTNIGYSDTRVMKNTDFNELFSFCEKKLSPNEVNNLAFAIYEVGLYNYDLFINKNTSNEMNYIINLIQSVKDNYWKTFEHRVQKQNGNHISNQKYALNSSLFGSKYDIEQTVDRLEIEYRVRNSLDIGISFDSKQLLSHIIYYKDSPNILNKIVYEYKEAINELLKSFENRDENVDYKSMNILLGILFIHYDYREITDNHNLDLSNFFKTRFKEIVFNSYNLDSQKTYNRFLKYAHESSLGKIDIKNDFVFTDKIGSWELNKLITTFILKEDKVGFEFIDSLGWINEKSRCDLSESQASAELPNDVVTFYGRRPNLTLLAFSLIVNGFEDPLSKKLLDNQNMVENTKKEIDGRMKRVKSVTMEKILLYLDNIHLCVDKPKKMKL